MFELLVIIVCLSLNAVFSAVEMAFVSVHRGQLRKIADRGDSRANTLLKLRLNPERTLSVLQVGITMVGAISAAVGGAGAEENLAPIIETTLKVSEEMAEGLSILIIVIPITIASVVIGELVPKSLALKYSIHIALFSARALYYFDLALAPIVNLLEGATKTMVSVFQKNNQNPNETSSAADEELVNIESLTPLHRQFVLNLVNIESKIAKDMMVPWEEVICVNIAEDMDKVLNTIINSGHTRVPVNSEDKVLGLLHTKEFISFVSSGETSWQSIVRPALQVHARADALKILRLMQDNRSHLSLVMQKEIPIGIITMEDVLEEIIGDIGDEDDDGIMKRLLTYRSRRRTLRGP